MRAELRVKPRPDFVGGNLSPARASASRAMRLSSCICAISAAAESNIRSSRIQSMKATSMFWP